MKKATAITCVFLDIGGVLLTDGWDHHARKRAAMNFKLKWAETEARHHLVAILWPEQPLIPVIHQHLTVPRTDPARLLAKAN